MNDCVGVWESDGGFLDHGFPESLVFLCWFNMCAEGSLTLISVKAQPVYLVQECVGNSDVTYVCFIGVSSVCVSSRVTDRWHDSAVRQIMN